MKCCQVLLFTEFETLDVFGPVEIFASLPDVQLELVSLAGGLVTSKQNYQTLTSKANLDQKIDYLLIPGGQGTRKLVNDSFFLKSLKKLSLQAQYVLTICTGAALLAKTGLLDQRQATSNKQAFEWVCSQNKHVDWQPQARWSQDGKFYTSSGVSAGMDMSLAFIATHYGLPAAQDIANKIEYVWQNDATVDPFAVT